MTKKEVADMIRSIGLPSAYYSFPKDKPTSPPFVCYYYPSDDDFKADGKNYKKINNLVIEFYSDEKDFDTEELIGAILNEHGLVYSWDETYIDSERMFMTAFYTETLIDDEEREE